MNDAADISLAQFSGHQSCGRGLPLRVGYCPSLILYGLRSKDA